MRIHGLNKTTLLDYPEHVAATIFLGGCNFRCPFCQNAGLVLAPESEPVIAEEEVLAFLKKRKGILSGVCISGGEPTLEPQLEKLIRSIRKLGYLVKLDTNGYRPQVLRRLLEEDLLDYIAMDVKNCLARYAETVGIARIDTAAIRESEELLGKAGIPYEFRTTVVKEYHTKEDMIAIGRELEGAGAYYLQGFEDSGQVLLPGLHSYGRGELEELAELIRPFVPSVSLRGVG